METKILTVEKAEYMNDYKIKALFNNGNEKIIDFKDVAYSKKGVFGKLKDLDYFKAFTIDPFTIDWNNEIGFAPEYLYEIGTTI